MYMRKQLTNLLIYPVLGSVAYGCAVVAVGAVGAVAGTGAVVATDPRNSGTVINDNTIEAKLSSKYSDYNNANIYTTVYNGTVLLTGQVPQVSMKESAEFEAKVSPGVKQIYDYLDVRLPQSFGAKSTDSYTTTQIRTKLLGIDNLSSNSIKVITTNDIVYLLGIVTPAQAKEASKAAADVGGVKKVVTLFEYVAAAPTQ